MKRFFQILAISVILAFCASRCAIFTEEPQVVERHYYSPNYNYYPPDGVYYWYGRPYYVSPHYTSPHYTSPHYTRPHYAAPRPPHHPPYRPGYNPRPQPLKPEVHRPSPIPQPLKPEVHRPSPIPQPLKPEVHRPSLRPLRLSIPSVPAPPRQPANTPPINQHKAPR